MRLPEEKKKQGYFWLPSKPDRKIPGTLIIPDGGRVELEIIDHFDDSVESLDARDTIPRIVGNVEGDGFVTLESSFYTIKSISLGGISRSRLLVNRAYTGVGYDESEAATFEEIQFSVEGLDEWVGISGIKVDRDFYSKTSTITYAPPAPIAMALGGGISLIIQFGWTLPGFPTTREARITQRTYFSLISDVSRPYDEFSEYIYKIVNFLCFGIDRTVSLMEVKGLSSEITQELTKGKNYRVPISIYYQSLPFSSDRPKIDIHSMLFRLSDFNGNPEGAMKRWLEAYETISPTLNLFFSTRTSGGYLESKFLSLAQALETFHRRTSSETLWPPGEFADIVKKVVDACPETLRDWIRARVLYGNEPSLASRLKKIVEPFSAALGGDDEAKKLVRKIVDTRNYLTHYDKSLESRAQKGVELWSLIQRMEAVLQLHLLRRVGFSDAQMSAVLDSNHSLKEKVGKI